MDHEIKYCRLSTVGNHYNRLLSLLNTLDPFYNPKISSKVKLDEYAKKLLSNGEVYVVMHKENDVGLIAIYTNDTQGGVAYLSSLGLLPQFQGKGISQSMMIKVFKLCEDKSMNIIRLETGEQNEKAIRFYKNNGFKIILINNDLSYVIMEKKLRD